MDLFKLSHIIVRHLRNETDEDEKRQLHKWMKLSAENEQFVRDLDDDTKVAEALSQFSKYNSELAWEKFSKQHIQKKNKRAFIQPFLRVAAVAAIILTFGLGIYYFTVPQKHALLAREVVIEPGKTNAIVHVAEQAPVVVNEHTSTQFTDDKQLMATVEDGHIHYETEVKKSVPMVVEVPVHSEYSFELADGSTVWMNAGSKVSFNHPFAANSREITVEGEVFLSVAKDASRPFIVHLPNDNAVQVLGTEFNIKAYPNSDEQQTVLVEGSILWRTHKGTERILEPGQLLAMHQTSNEIEVRDVDTTPYTAWKSGRFVFDNRELESIMDDLSRWYGCSVVFENESLKTLHFSGDIRRYENLSGILDLIRITGKVDFEVTKNKVIVKTKS